MAYLADSEFREKFVKLVGFTAFLTYVLIVLGAMTRAADAGMSCPDWPMCYGELFPFPVPSGAGYTTYQVALEWSHRLLAAIVGLLVVVSFWKSLKFRGERPALLLFSMLSVVALISQIILGKITVNMSNVSWSVALHLGNAAILFGFLIVIRRLGAIENYHDENNKFPTSGAARTVLWIFSLCILLTMLLGAMVSTSGAGAVCGGLPDCFGEWKPDDNLQFLHMKHRFMALGTLLIAGLFWIISRSEHHALKRTAKGIAIVVSLQAVIGVIVLYSFTNYAMAYQFLSVFHLAWGMLIVMICFGALTKVYFGTEGCFHRKSAELDGCCGVDSEMSSVKSNEDDGCSDK